MSHSDRITSTERPAVPLSVQPGLPNPPTAAPVYSDLWGRPGDHERDMAGCGEDER